MKIKECLENQGFDTTEKIEDLADDMTINRKTMKAIIAGKEPNAKTAWKFVARFGLKFSDIYGPIPTQECDYKIIKKLYYKEAK